MDTVVRSWSLGGEMVSALAQNARDVGLIPAVGTLFPISLTPTTVGICHVTPLVDRISRA